MKRTPIIVAASAVVLGAAWGLFRPELLFVNKTVSEAFPVAHAAPVVMAANDNQAAPELTGQFHKAAHETKGTASIYKLQDGKRVLRLTDFMTSNGPDVRVLLVAAGDASDSDAVKKAGYVELGKLKGTDGDQNYEIPASVDLSNHRAVTIWCNRFSVNFGTAPLADKM